MLSLKDQADTHIRQLLEAVARNDNKGQERECIALGQLAFGAFLMMAEGLHKIANPFVGVDEEKPWLTPGAPPSDPGLG